MEIYIYDCLVRGGLIRLSQPRHHFPGHGGGDSNSFANTEVTKYFQF